MFSGGRNAAGMFGSNLYFVRGEGFDLVPAPNVIFGEKPSPSELEAGHIVMFEVDGRTDVGEIRESGVEPPPVPQEPQESGEPGEPGDSEESEPAEYTEYTSDSYGIAEEETLYFALVSEDGSELIISEHDILAKAVRTSRLLGHIFNFAVSPAGVLVIAVIPCVCIILSEVFKPLFARAKVTPVNKQDETPTFIQQNRPEPPDVSAKPPKPSKPSKPLKPSKPPVTAAAESSGLIEAMQSPELFVPVADDSPPKPVNTVNYAALKAYKDTLKSSQGNNSGHDTPNATPGEMISPQLFAVVEDVAATVTPPAPPPPPVKKKPLSSVKLAEVIAAANAERERAANSGRAEQPDEKPMSVSEKSRLINDAISAYNEQANDFQNRG
jgi:hypothetical protein